MNPWGNSSMEEQRLKFIKAVSEIHRSLTFERICEDFNISRKTGYKWLHRYQKEGEKGLKDRSRARITHCEQILDEVKECVIAIRNNFKWGPKKIKIEMINFYNHLPTPSTGSIGKILKENYLSHSRIYRRHVAQTDPLVECNHPNDVWMYDFKGWFYTADGSKCEPLTITDGFSRYLIKCVHMHRKRTKDVLSILEEAFLEYGLPLKMRSDNGPPFATIGVGRLSPLAIKLIKIGVIPEWIEPGCPQQNGRHERFHLTLKNETASPPTLNLTLQQLAFDQFLTYYNTRRPHEALGQVPPTAIYRPSKRIWDGKYRQVEYGSGYDVRKVDKGGIISWHGQRIFLSESLWQEYVGIKEIDIGVMGIYYSSILLGKIDLSKGFKRM